MTHDDVLRLRNEAAWKVLNGHGPGPAVVAESLRKIADLIEREAVIFKGTPDHETMDMAINQLRRLCVERLVDAEIVSRQKEPA